MSRNWGDVVHMNYYLIISQKSQGQNQIEFA